MAGAIEAHATTLPGLSGSHLLAGAGHWVHQERAEDVNRLLLEWLTSERSGGFDRLAGE